MMASREDLLREEADAWRAFLEVADGAPMSCGRCPMSCPAGRSSISPSTTGSGPSWRNPSRADGGRHVHRRGATREVWQAMNAAWADESKSLTWEQAVAAAEADRMKARTALRRSTRSTSRRRRGSEETFEYYAEHADEIARFAERS